MSLRNKVILFGHTGKDVEVTQFEKGIKASVSLAIMIIILILQGEKIEETQWHNLIVYGKLAEVLKSICYQRQRDCYRRKINITEAMKIKTEICVILLRSE